VGAPVGNFAIFKRICQKIFHGVEPPVNISEKECPVRKNNWIKKEKNQTEVKKYVSLPFDAIK